ncbi:protein phosphatase Slingshot homolog 3 [Spea bombifrons]|uniref:protein phosphatase Slingshot homolog 3 n=1 Tax=Spea bombifrons TaxID=233779 RepID=UPI002349C479|nr:protein phosphatase Slingshot homolog 3 [Spea bombifrons]
MSLVTLQLSAVDGAPNFAPAQEDEKSRRKRMQRRQSFVMVKGAAILLQDEGDQEQAAELPPTSGPSEQQLHLQAMLRLLRAEDILKLAVRLEPVRLCLIRYLLVVSSAGASSDEETILLGVDFPHDGSQDCTIGTVLPVWSNTQVFLDGDGGFSVTSGKDVRAFKPISVQTMWSLLQMLHKACEAAESSNVIPESILHSGVTYYQGHRGSPQGCLNAWMSTSDIVSTRRDPTTPEREETERIIRNKLRDILRASDLENITSKEVRRALEQHTLCNLQDYMEFIDNEMMMILAQMDRPSEIFPYLYLGSEWNASNLEELQKNKVTHILNVTREIDNFFPDIFTYLNIRVLDEDSTDLMQHWKETHRFISSARRQGSSVLVHCKMGVSRSASTVIAYAMKEYEWTLEEALKYVKERRSIVQPNSGFLRQLQIYQGILGASKQRHCYLWDPSSTPPISQVISPLETLHGTKATARVPRALKISLRTLMRSISEMEGTENVTSQEEIIDIAQRKTMSERDESVLEKVDTASEREDSITEMNKDSIKEGSVEDVTEATVNEVQNETMLEEKEIREPFIQQSHNPSQDSIPMQCDEDNTSVDEVFGNRSPSSQSPRAASSSARRRSRRRRKHLAQQSSDHSQHGFSVKSPSVSDLEGAGIVSKRLQNERRARIVRQSNIAETSEDI